MLWRIGKEIFWSGNRRYLFWLPYGVLRFLEWAINYIGQKSLPDFSWSAGPMLTALVVALGLILALALAWHDRYEECGALNKRIEAITAASEIEKATLRALIGRPRALLTCDSSAASHGNHIGHEECSDITIEAVDRSAYDVWLNPFSVGGFVIQGSYPIHRIAVGTPVRLPYLVHESDVANLHYRGHLTQLLDDTLASQEEGQFSAPVRITYTDINGTPWHSDLVLEYTPGIHSYPVFVPAPIAGSPHSSSLNK